MVIYGFSFPNLQDSVGVHTATIDDGSEGGKGEASGRDHADRVGSWDEVE